MSSSSIRRQQSIEARAGSSHLSSSLRRNHSTGDVHRIDDVGVDTGIGSRLSLGDHGRSAPTTGQRHRRALTYPYPSHLLLEGASSTHLSNTLTLTSTPDPPREAGPSGSQRSQFMPSPPMPPVPPMNSSRTIQPRPDSGYPQMDPETERIMLDYQRRQTRTFRGRSRQLRAFFGYGAGNRARKEFVQLIWTLAFGFVQFSVTISFMSLAAVRSSPQNPSISEWKACDKPLGVWNVLWLVKVVFDCSMSYWSWTRDRKLRDRERDAESGNNRLGQGNAIEAQPGALNPILQELGIPEETPAAIAARERRRRQAALPLTGLFQRLNVLLSILIVSWFITCNILIYTSLRTCRFAAPHLWWLTFSILSIQYFMIVEVFAIAIIVFIIGPLIFLFWNIFLICLGRHPLQNPHYINPEIGKLSKNIVEKIPLVLYIPPPPEEELKEKDEAPNATSEARTSGERVGREEEMIVDGASVEPSAFVTEQAQKQEQHEVQGEETHTYPPLSPPPPIWTSKTSRFSFFVRRPSKAGVSTSANGEPEHPPYEGAWEDTWERGNERLPFIRLAGNRAVCAVCLMDFEAPKRRVARSVIRGWSSFGNLLKSGGDGRQDPEKGGGEDGEGKAENAAGTGAGEANAAIQEVPVGGENTLRLVDAGDGPQPLRLLPCGHVFHKTCIDPWLIDVSGRCPTCQRPVVLPDSSSKKTRDRNSS